MVRSTEEEFRRRRILREKYFEDPNYRRWSDIVPGGLSGRLYTIMRDDCLFDYYITNQRATQSNTMKLKIHLRDGHKLPINWANFYAYFDEVLNDPESKFVSELTTFKMTNFDGTYDTTVKRLLDKYRDHLTNSYDII